MAPLGLGYFLFALVTFFIVVIESCDQRQLIDKSVCFGVWFRELRVPYRREAWREQELGEHISQRKLREQTERGQGYKPSNPTLHDVLLQEGCVHLLKVSEPPQTALPTEDQVLKNLSYAGDFSFKLPYCPSFRQLLQ